MSERHDRHGFLGPRSEEIIRSIRAGIVGVNGGGSHCVQQCGHVGLRRFVICDPGNIDTESNISRNVISTVEDFERRAAKVGLAERKLHGIVQGGLELEPHVCRWQEQPDALATCDVIFGGVDTFKERHELEAFARRHLIPYIDIGLDVNTVGNDPPRMAGQVILSMPGSPCMWCLGFLTDELLAREAAKYGDVGGRAQVVWANGVLASTAVGIAIDLFCDWTKTLRQVVHLSYDGNSGCVTPDSRLPYLGARSCPHYPITEVGAPRYAPQ
jgi:molybdopterin-synthase adenylyltransferase